MSTQESEFPSVPFSIAQNLQNVRLLEVPEELLQIITNTEQSLYFKSTPAASHAKNGAEGKEGNVHLCADDRVWAVKQVSTSNSIYVTRASSSELNIGSNGGDDDHGEMEVDSLEKDKRSNSCVSAVAKPTSILELHALPPATYEAMVLDHLNDMIPTISSTLDIPVTETSETYGLAQIHNHVPAPSSVIKRVLSQRCAFEISKPTSQSTGENSIRSQAYIPSSSLLLSTWTEIMEVATLTGANITGLENIGILDQGMDNKDLDDLSISMSEEQQTKSIYRAISRRLFQKDGYLTSIGVINNENGKLNDRECTRWVGNLMLAAAQDGANTSGISKEGFEKKWEDNVPTNWIKYCSVEVLRPACELTTVDGTDTVRWAPFGLEGDGAAGNGAAGSSQARPGAAAGGAKNKRKWHEKFAGQRNLKK